MTETRPEITARAREIVDGWEAAEKADRARRRAHAKWITYMVEVERIRPETLPCVHGTSFWPDRGQVCGYCEAEAEDPDTRTRAQRRDDRWRAALIQAERELAPVEEWSPLHPF